MEDKPALGGQRIKLKCPNCGHEVTVLDRDIVEFGPVRCGACGEQVRRAGLERLVEDALAGRTRE